MEQAASSLRKQRSDGSTRWVKNMSSQQLIPDYSYRDDGWMESRRHCAFNQTRNSFLGLSVVVGDFSFLSLANWMSNLLPDSGAGLWISPFRGLPSTIENIQLDLVYLDADCRVIDLVKSYPESLVSLSSQPASSVLALPLAAISSSGTRRGDLLIICAADELKRFQNRVGDARSRTFSIAADVEGPVRPTGRTLQFPGVEQSRSKDPSEPVAPPTTVKPVELIPDKQNTKSLSPWRACLARWFPRGSSDRRRAPRESVADLTASFWTGGRPAVHAVRDISSSGLFVTTMERWYPGTVIRMTLTKLNAADGDVENSICVCAEAIRWGNDGVGLRFVLENAQKNLRGRYEAVEGADREQLDQFLKGLHRGEQQSAHAIPGSPLKRSLLTRSRPKF